MSVVVNFIKMFKSFHLISNMDPVARSILVPLLPYFAFITIHGILAGGRFANSPPPILVYLVSMVTTSANFLVKQAGHIHMRASPIILVNHSSLVVAIVETRSLRN